MRAAHLTAGRWLAWMVALTLLLGVAVVVSSVVGITRLDLGAALTGGGREAAILFDVRLPRVVLAIIVGAGLGVTGATLQAILRNPLADPFILGVSGGAALGGTLALVAASALAAVVGADTALSEGAVAVRDSTSALGTLPVSIMACLGALGAVALTFAVARSAGGTHPHSLLLSGVVFNAFASAIILFLRTVVTQEKAQELLYWLVGTLGYRPWGHIAVAAALVAAGTLVLVVWSARLNLMAAGDAGAALLGVDVERSRLVLVVVTSLVVGTVVSLAGLVGFVGLMVPHLLRLLVGPDHRLLVPAAAVGGALFLVVSDLVARLLFLLLGTEPPVGVVTAFLGGPFFLALMRHRGGVVA